MKRRLKRGLTTHKVKNKRLEKAVHEIRQGDDFEREKAIEYLISRSTKKTVKCVLPLLWEKDTSTRMAALEIIKKTGHTNIDAIIELLENDNEDIRVYACSILAGLKTTETISHLIKVLDKDSENVKNAAVVALGEFDDDRAVKALLGMLQDDQWIVFSAICGLGKTRHQMAAEPLFRIYQNSEEEISLAACEVLMGYEDDEILDRIFNVLQGWNKKKRARYVEVVIQQGNENLFLRLKKKMGQDLFEHLLTYITNGNQRVIHILKLMTHFKNVQACDVLLDNLGGMDPDEAEYDEVLGLFVSLSQVWKHNLKEYLCKGDEYALAITKACGQIEIRIEEDLLLALFNASSAIVRREIIKNADKIVSGKGYDLLKEALKDQDGHVKSHAVHAVAVLGLIRLKDDIIDLAKEGFMDVRINALKALVELDNDEAMRLLHQFVFTGSNEDKKAYLAVAKNITGDENFPLIRRLFSNSDQDIKKTAASAIGNFIDDERYIGIFQKLLQDETIPHDVLKIIKEKKLTQFRPQLKKIFADTSKGLWTRYYVLLALGAFEDPSLFELFTQGLNDENNLIKIGSLKALSDLGDAKAIDYVKPYVNSKDEDVRSTAEFVMSSLGEHQ
jgi:HEAT repeat protein